MNISNSFDYNFYTLYREQLMKNGHARASRKPKRGEMPRETAHTKLTHSFQDRPSTESSTAHMVYAPHASTARKNKSVSAQLLDRQLSRPFAQGENRYVALAKYTSGERHGQLCVVKRLKMRQTLLSDPFKYDVKATHRAALIISEWNSRADTKPIRINMPAVWRLGRNLGRLEGERVLVEPFIEQFQNYNSNTGWVDTSTRWGRKMQALSHYSYHMSGGHLLLCDLQGGFYDSHAVVTDPVVHSTTRSYGPADMGSEGISNFFAHHKCNEYCRKSWKKPEYTMKYFSAVRSTYTLKMK